ncbi:MAG: hypothetical protein ABEI06_06695, partial [Halobacteriaceae archaeon]
IGDLMFGPSLADPGSVVGAYVYVFAGIVLFGVPVFIVLQIIIGLIPRVIHLLGFDEIAERIDLHWTTQLFRKTIRAGNPNREATNISRPRAFAEAFVHAAIFVLILGGVLFYLAPYLGRVAPSLGIKSFNNIAVAFSSLVGLAIAFWTYRLWVAFITAITGAALVANVQNIRPVLIALFSADVPTLLRIFFSASVGFLVIFGLVFLTGFGSQIYFVFSNEP